MVHLVMLNGFMVPVPEWFQSILDQVEPEPVGTGFNRFRFRGKKLGTGTIHY
ncbi:hypothetical protein F511_14851 [Dorcoceras hygrometricum]|uniref:Uncharacterized protein n=1 Tax=Dorcoceras hygrometricum TaxID=472368 RepID=A0A2Z7D2K2_9LAMI|nr:hypothetical protein F511_14851 [Dorcoceras hygrometricum]